MKKQFSIYISLAIIVTASSCNKEPGEGEEKKFPYKAIPQEVRDYGWFNVGSYWIYEDSASKQLDSIYVYGSEIKVNRNYNDSTPLTDFEILYVYAKSAQTGIDYIYGMSIDAQLKGFGAVMQYGARQIGEFPPNSEFLWYPFIIGKINNGLFGEVILYDTLPNVIIEGNTYSKVKLYYSEKDARMNLKPTLTWVAPNFGIVKKQNLQTKETYWLKRSNIIKK